MAEEAKIESGEIPMNYNDFVGMNLNLGTRFASTDITNVEDIGEFLEPRYISLGKDVVLRIKKDWIKREGDSFVIATGPNEFGNTSLEIYPKFQA